MMIREEKKNCTLPSKILDGEADHIIQREHGWQVGGSLNFFRDRARSELRGLHTIHSIFDWEVTSPPNFRRKETRDQFVD